MGIRIRIEPDRAKLAELDRRVGLLGNPSTFGKVYGVAANRAVRDGKSEASKKIREVYTISPARKVNATITTRSFRDGAKVEISDSPQPLRYFKVSPKSPPKRKRRGVTVQVRNDSSGNKIDDWFVPSGLPVVGVFSRSAGTSGRASAGSNPKAIRQRYGPGAANMAKDEEIVEAVEERMTNVFNSELESAVDRILG